MHNKLKPAAENGTGVTLRLCSDKIGTNQKNISHNLLLTNTQVASLCKAFVNYSSKNVKLSKTCLNKVKQSSDFLGRLLGPLSKVELLLMKNALRPLAKSVPVPLGLREQQLMQEFMKIIIMIQGLWIWNNNTNYIKQRNERHYVNS